MDGRLRNAEEIENLTVGVVGGRPVSVKDFARVERGPEPVFNVVTADGVNAVLLNVRSQPDGSTLNIARDLQAELAKLHRELPPDMKLAFFYDQSQLVRAGHRRLRPVLMTSLAAGLGMLPLAYGIGSGADMLKPLAIGVIGALCFSLLFSLIATPLLYRVLSGR